MTAASSPARTSASRFLDAVPHHPRTEGDPMTDYMTVDRFARKVEWEGGITDALEWGLHATHLDPDDEASKPLRDAWAALETVWREQYRPLEERVAAILEDISEAAEGGAE